MIRQTLTFLTILFLQWQVFGQTSSSYSRYGIGDIEYTYSARKSGMGQLGVSVSDLDFINSTNPAGWNNINRTRIEFGVSFSGMTLASEGNQKFYSDSEFSGFTIAFPVSTVYGTILAAGIIPYSNVSYNVVENYSSPEAGDYKISYTGTGGLSKIFFGSSFKFPMNLSIGATFDYYFGNLNYTSRADFTDPGTKPAEYVRTYSPKGVGTTVGVISPDFSNLLDSKSITDMRIGVSANIFSSLSTDTILASLREGIIDTISGAVVDLKMPPRIYTGLSFVLGEEYLVTLDYAFQLWENYRFNGQSDENLRNSAKISGGFEYRPSKEIGSTFWEQILLRAGLTYEKTQFTFEGTGINYYGIASGFSLPLGSSETLDFAVQYGIRGAEEYIKENILRISAGISLGDLWFMRQEK